MMESSEMRFISASHVECRVNILCRGGIVGIFPGLFKKVGCSTPPLKYVFSLQFFMCTRNANYEMNVSESHSTSAQ